MNVGDSLIFEFINNLTGKLFLIDGVFIFLSEYLIYILVGVFGLYILKIKSWKERMHMFSLGLLGVILSRGIFTPLIRFFFERQRPFVALNIDSLISHAETGSFPSGHIAFITPLVIALWYINKRAGTWGFVGAILVGVARIGAGVHWPTDILGGFLVGIISYAIVQGFLKIKPSKKERSVKTDTPQ